MTRRPPPQHPPPGDGWQARAACQDKDSRLFTDPDSPDDVRKALATCATCSVRAACLAAALRHSAEADVGIWGGTTEQTRHRIRTGRLTVEQALNPDEHQDPEPRKQRVNGTAGHQPDSAAGRPLQVPRLPAPETTVRRDTNGDYISADQRVLIFRIHGNRPWALAIDDRVITTTCTVTEARRIAWATLHDHRQASLSAAEARQAVAPGQPPRRR
jgi:hypothetical protein